jgi:selenocysteine-specific elongation factor
VIHRGHILATKDSMKPTFMVDVVLDLLASAPRKLKNRAKVRFHTGTCEIISTVVLLDRDELEPGQTCFAQIRLDEPTAVLRKDRYVLRSYSPVRTIGGGEILNALPRKKKRFSDISLTEMKSLHQGDPAGIVELFVGQGRFLGMEQDALPFLTNMSRKQLEDILKGLMAKNQVVRFDKENRVLIQADFLEKARKELLDTISEYHRKFPLKVGLPKEELRSRTTGSRNPKLFNFLISQLTKEGRIVLEKDLARLEGHRVTLAADQQKTRKEIEEIYVKSGLQPPYFKEIKDKFPDNTAFEVLELMHKEGSLVKVKEDLYFHKRAIEKLEKDLVGFLKEHREITTPQFKDMTGASRKYTIPLIEYFDGSQVTVRVGDSRVLRRK